MPSVTNKAYDVLLSVLGHLIKGVQKHASNQKITASISVEELEALKKDLEFLRANYLLHERQAREAYDQFNTKFKAVQKRISNDCRIIKGILDPRSTELEDFGITPERTKSKKDVPVST